MNAMYAYLQSMVGVAAKAMGLQNLAGFFRTGNGFGSFS